MQFITLRHFVSLLASALVRALSPLAVALSLVALLSIVSAQAIAKGEEPLQGVLEQFRVVRLADGKESRVPAENIKPGETLEYLVRYTNKGEVPVSQFVVTLPIPQGLELMSLSDQPRAALASTDGVVFNAQPLKRRVRQADGRDVIEDVPLVEYRALRWQIGQLDAGKSVQFAARAKVDAASNAPVISKQPTVQDGAAAKRE
jgi:uncharacterized repeat protein (TIGR01451 family)